MTVAVEKQGCYQGYYEDGGCKQCHESCKECSDGSSCDTCEDYMYLREVESGGSEGASGGKGEICVSCAEGEYYDKTQEVCRSCNGSCKYMCGYQKDCFECGTGYLFDLEENKCIHIHECSSNKLILENPKYNLPSICRSPEYYINPFSSKEIELGTYEYPYRSFSALSTEILNIHSHTNYTVTIFTTDAYFEDGDLMMVNMTNVVLKSHPDILILSSKHNLHSKSYHLIPPKNSKNPLKYPNFFQKLRRVLYLFRVTLSSMGSLRRPDFIFCKIQRRI
ncbi:unnamed protein product [Moneuplotes crassus]|uniref:Uncharacterized protein n=1 Tax=Euplotes crassus TaxID=5936 RepID=A0AAD1XUC5_EUPCR|nr:unnamed protein product [Moneuplotes crassus]